LSHLFLDFETRSRLPISRGTEVYARSAEPTVLCWALDDGPVHTWELGMRRPERFINLCYDPQTVLVAHNIPFDAAILKYCWDLDLPPERLHCTQAQAYSHSLPGSLGALAPALGLPVDHQKDMEGHKLMMFFCQPQRNGRFPDRTSHPAEWAKFLDYARQDVVALREVFRALPTHNYAGKHKEIWNLDYRINTRGVRVDLELAAAAVKVMEKAKRRVDAKVAELTDGEITAATQRDRVLHRLVLDGGLALIDAKASTLRAALEDEALDPATRQLIELRLEGSKNAASKYQKMLDTAGPDGRVRYTLQFAGADRTGRWAGRGIQPQNLFRPAISDFEYIEECIIPGILNGDVLDKRFRAVYDTPAEACANALRSAIMADEGHEFVVADWSNIEGRVLAWLAGEEWKLYKLIFSRSFSKPIEELTKTDRQVGKCQDLACGFGGSVGAFVGFAAIYNLSLDMLADTVPSTVSRSVWEKALSSFEWAVENERDYGLDRGVFAACHSLVQIYRTAHPATQRFWYDLHGAMINATNNPGHLYRVRLLKVWRSGAWLIVELPSGRRLMYASPKIKRNKEGKEVLTYMNAKGKQWRRLHSWHGLTTENAVQAVANDILRDAMPRAEAVAPIVLHVHDEIVTEPEVGAVELQQLIDAMVQGEPWTEGLPLAAAGYVATRYRKD
jgi:DNA polymerase bacteriophage-type